MVYDSEFQVISYISLYSLCNLPQKFGSVTVTALCSQKAAAVTQEGCGQCEAKQCQETTAPSWSRSHGKGAGESKEAGEEWPGHSRKQELLPADLRRLGTEDMETKTIGGTTVLSPPACPSSLLQICVSQILRPLRIWSAESNLRNIQKLG